MMTIYTSLLKAGPFHKLNSAPSHIEHFQSFGSCYLIFSEYEKLREAIFLLGDIRFTFGLKVLISTNIIDIKEVDSIT